MGRNILSEKAVSGPGCILVPRPPHLRMVLSHGRCRLSCQDPAIERYSGAPVFVADYFFPLSSVRVRRHHGQFLRSSLGHHIPLNVFHVINNSHLVETRWLYNSLAWLRTPMASSEVVIQRTKRLQHSRIFLISHTVLYDKGLKFM